MLKMVYFSFTSLTTVGFGDLHPKTDFERLFIAFGLMFGVSIFSYLMGTFIEMFERYRVHNDSNEEADSLSKFFGILKRFNHDEEIDDQFKRSLESYFSFKWENDKNQILSLGQYSTYFEQLPEQVLDNMLNDYLFMGFLKIFHKFFDIPLINAYEKHARFTISDRSYQVFLRDVLRLLEPMRA